MRGAERTEDAGSSGERTIIGRALLDARLAQGISRSALARAAGCSRQYVEMLESGDRSHPSAQLIASFAAALGLQGAERAAFFQQAGMASPSPAPDDRFSPATLAARLADTLPHPAFVIDAFWSLLSWNLLVPRVFETYMPGLPAGTVSLLEIVFDPDSRDRFLNWDEVTVHLAASFKRDTRPLLHTSQYRQTLRALRRLPGFAAIFKMARPTATATAASLFGFRHSRFGPLWFAEALTVLPGHAAPRVLSYVAADPVTATALGQIGEEAGGSGGRA